MGRGIPVPPVIPEGSKAFTICVPDDPFFYGVVMGALKVMTFNYYWQGSREQIELVTDRMKTMYFSYQDQDGCMDCAQVADCIENDAGTQEAIANAIRTSTSIQDALRDAYDEFQRGKDMPPDVSGQDVTGANPGCNLDKLWGWIIAGVNEMDTNNRDSQQVVETISNQWERISSLVAAIPGLGVLPVDEIIGYVQGLWSDDLIDAYEANDTLTYRRQIACDLFCLAQDNGCTLTLDMMLNYFLNRIAYSGLQTVGNIVGYLIGGTWSGTQINDTFYIAQLAFLKFGNAFFKLVGIKPIEIMFQLGEPSDDWMLLCESCIPTYTVTNVGIIGRCGEGALETFEVEAGEEFEAEAFEDPLYPGNWTIALRLPAGDWQVEMTGFTGSIVPPADLNQYAYAWVTTGSVLTGASWNAPASPDEFGTQDTNQTGFAPWCDTEVFNAVIFNCAAFSATFKITPL